MATKDFRASQLEVSKIIASGGMTGNGLIAKNNLGLAIYSGSAQSNREGGITRNIFSKVGSDVFMFVSGSLSKKGTRRQEVSLFGGDVVISGTLYAERQVIEVDSVADGDFYVTGNVYFEPDANSTTSVAFRNAAGSTIFNVDATNKRIGINDTTPDALLDIQGESDSGVPSLKIDHDDADVVGIDIDSANTTNVVMDLASTTLTTGKMLHINENSSDTGTRNVVEIKQNHASATGATAVKIQADSNGPVAALHIDRNAAGTVAADGIKGIYIDLDQTGEITSATANVVGVDVEIETNSAADGTVNAFGQKITMTGDTDGTHSHTGLSINLGDADNNTHIELLSSADTGDKMTIGVGAAGASTITTVDDDAANAHLTMNIDGNFDLNPAGAITIDGTGTSNLTTNGALTVSGSTGLNLHSDGGEIDITATKGNIDINATAGTLDIDTAGAISIDSSGASITVGAASVNQTIGIGGGGNRSINIGNNGGTSTVSISSKGGTLLLDGTGQTVDINSTALDIDSAGAITIDGTSTFSIDGVGTSNVTTNGALTVSGSTGLNLHSDGGEIDLTTRVGAIDVNSAAAVTINAAGASNFTTSTGDLTLASSAGQVVLDAQTDIVLDANGADVIFKDDGASIATFSNSSSDLIISSSVSDKDIIFKGSTGGSSHEIFRVDTSVKNILMSAGNNVSFGAATRYIGDGTDYNSNANAVVIAGSHDVILGPGAGAQAFVSLGANGQFVVADGEVPKNYLMITGSDLGGIISASNHNASIIFHSDGAKEALNLLGSGQVVFNDPGPLGSDTSFSVSGSINKIGVANSSGVAVFGGDLLVSGNTRLVGTVIVGGSADNRMYFDANGLANGPWIQGSTTVLTIDGDDRVDLKFDKEVRFQDSITGNQVMRVLETTADTATESQSDAIHIFSGSIGSKKTTTRGTSIFSGDVVVSGALDINTVSVTADGKLGIGTSNPSYKLEVGGNAAFGEYLYHRGDVDTSIRFETDKITLTAGNEALLTLTEATQDIVTVGDGGDVDFQVRTNGDDNTLFVQGSSDRVGIGTNAPSTVLHVKESAPTVTIQRESNANNSTLQFMGQAGATATVLHMGSTNDLVMTTFDGVDQEEILRLGSHYSSDVRQVILLSGSAMGTGAMQPKQSSDINFFVSGALDSRNTTTKGTSVFGGDTYTSGSIHSSAGNLSGAGFQLAIKEVLTNVSTSGTTTTLSNFFPALGMPYALSIRVTTGIGNGGYITKIGVTGIDDLFGGHSDNGGALNDNVLEQSGDMITMGINGGDGAFSTVGGANLGLNTAKNLLITHAAQPDAGAIRAVLWYWQLTPPTS